MDMHAIPEAIRSLYSCPWIRANRIARMEQQILGRFALDAETAWELGTNNVGVFVGGCWADIFQRLAKLDSQGIRPSWLIVAATNADAQSIQTEWLRRNQEPTSSLPQRCRNVILATPEKLRCIDSAIADELAGILLFDPHCIVYRARGHEGGPYYRNNRPRHVMAFRVRLAQEGWMPPFFLLTNRLAKATNTDSVARAFCLDAFWFLDGGTLSCGPLRNAESDRDDPQPTIVAASAAPQRLCPQCNRPFDRQTFFCSEECLSEWQRAHMTHAGRTS